MVSEPFLAIFVHAPAAVGVNVNDIVTLTSNHATCSECYTGKNNNSRESGRRAHIKKIIDNASAGGLVGDAL